MLKLVFQAQAHKLSNCERRNNRMTHHKLGVFFKITIE